MSMPGQVQIITIDGQKHEAVYVEKDAQGRRTGIVTKEETFWLEPVCDYRGQRPDPLPPMAPSEVMAVSFNEASAPRSFIRYLQAEWQRLRKQWMASTFTERLKLLREGRVHDKYRGKLLRLDDKTPNLSWPAFKFEWFVEQKARLMIGLEANGLRRDFADRDLERIRYMAVYPDQSGTTVYLAAVTPASHSREEAHEVRMRLSRELADSGPGIKAEIQKVGEAVTEFRAEQKDANKQAATERAEIKSGVEEVKPLVKGVIAENEGLRVASAEKDQLLAANQRELSAGFMVTDPKSELQQRMSAEETFLYNQLVQPNPARPGWAKSYRAIGKVLGKGVTHTEVQRRREEVEAKYPALRRFIATARSKNDKETVHPDRCGSGGKVKVRGPNDDQVDDFDRKRTGN